MDQEAKDLAEMTLEMLKDQRNNLNKIIIHIELGLSEELIGDDDWQKEMETLFSLAGMTINMGAAMIPEEMREEYNKTVKNLHMIEEG